MYSVLKFPEIEDPAKIVPTSWVDETRKKTKWPPYDDDPPEKILKAIRECITPEDNWPEYPYLLLVCKCGKLKIFLVFLKKLNQSGENFFHNFYTNWNIFQKYAKSLHRLSAFFMHVEF